MATNVRNTGLFERIRRIASYICFDKELRKDVVQEAWIRCQEYAGKQGKLPEALSNIEIKYRCLEALRTLRHQHEYLVPEDETLENIPDIISPDPLEASVRKETAHYSAKTLGTIEWILREHPKLKLAPRQWEIYHELRRVSDESAYGWRTRYANHLGVTRQNIWNIERIVRGKIIAAKDLVELLNGNIAGFFAQYGKIWHSPALMTVLRPVSIFDVPEPTLEVCAAKKLRVCFENLQNDMLVLGSEILAAQAKQARTANDFDAKQLAIGYHLIRRGTRVNPKKAEPYLKKLYAENFSDWWLIRRFTKSCLLFTDKKLFEQDKEELKYLIRKEDPESGWYAAYILTRHGGARTEDTTEFLKTAGKSAIRNYRIENAIEDIYNDLKNDRRTRHSTHFDSTFLRLILMMKHYRHKEYPGNTKNIMVNIGQMACHSDDAFIISEGEKMALGVT